MSRRRRIWSGALRWAFVAAVIVFAALGFAGQWQAILDAIVNTPPLVIGTGLLFSALGTAVTVPVFMGLLGALGVRLPWRPTTRILLVGQLGKYLPGSVWSVGAQARLGQPYGIPARSALTASSAFILFHLIGAVVTASLGLSLGWIDWSIPDWIPVGIIVAALVVLSPPVTSRVLGRVAGTRAIVTWRATAIAVALGGLSWAFWGAAVAVLAADRLPPGELLSALAPAAAAYALAYAAGLVVVIAPAGLGVREAILIALLQPIFGTVGAAAIALLGRVISTLSDFILALLAYAGDRSRPVASGSSEPEGELPRSRLG